MSAALASLPAPLFRCATPGEAAGTRPPWALCVALAVGLHAVAIGVALRIPVAPPKVEVTPPEIVFFAALPPPPASTGPKAAQTPAPTPPRRQARRTVKPTFQAPAAEPAIAKPRVAPPSLADPPDAAPELAEPPSLAEPAPLPGATALTTEGSSQPPGVLGGVAGGVSGASAEGVQDVRSVRQPPGLLEQVRPRYPETARLSHVEGSVLVRVVIGIDGRVERAQVVRSVPMLDEAALTAVRQWRFSPALGNAGTPVRVRVDIPLRFSLR